MIYTAENEALESHFTKQQTFLKQVKCNPNMTQNWHVYANCSRLEADGDVISS